MDKTIHSLFFLIIFLFSSTAAFSQVDYGEDIQPIFNANCTSCHGGTSGVTLTSYNAVMNSEGDQYGSEIVVPDEPDESPLVDKIEPSPDFGSRMPQGGSLSDAQISLIRQWISEGANETATSRELLTDLPKGYKLVGSYPNPFNPVTNIKFEVPEAASYTVSVYSANGLLIGETVGTTSAGTEQVRIDLSNQSSGVYFYQVKASAGLHNYLLGTGKMTLIK